MKIPSSPLAGAALLGLALTGCRSQPAVVDDVVKPEHLEQLAQGVVHDYLEQVEALVGHTNGSQVRLAVLDASSDLRSSSMTLRNFERYVLAGFTKDKRVDMVGRKFVDQILAEVAKVAPINPKDPGSLMVPAVNEQFRAVARHMQDGPNYVAWVELSAQSDDLILQLTVMGIDDGRIDEPVVKRVHVSHLREALL